MLLVGRQVPTDFGNYIDLLAVDDEGALHILEFKRDKTPRDVVAQLLDSGTALRAAHKGWPTRRRPANGWAGD